jgi:tetratricopeptide (TPR) repeat protein
MMRRPNPIVLGLAIPAAVSATLLVGGCQVGPTADQRGREAKAQQYMVEADRYLEQGLLDSALAAFGLALEENPNLVDAHMGMGEIYRERGDFELASRAYERATSNDPTNFDAHYYLGLMRQLVGRVQDAIQAYLLALAINPESAEANRDLAAAYLQAGLSSEALPYAIRATRLDPDSQAAWANLAATYSLMGRFDDAIDAYRQAAELGDLADPVLLGFADAHLRLSNYQRAITVLRTLLRSSESATAYERLGFAQFKLRDFDAALDSYRRALRLDANETAALNGVGASLMTMYIQGGRERTSLRDEAIASWRRSVQLRPDQPRIVDLLARYSRL